MIRISFLFVLLFAVIKNGFGSIDDEPDIFLMGENIDKNMLKSLFEKLEKDVELFKELMPDPYEKVDSATKLILEQVISQEYTAVISNLAEDDEFSYMIKVAAIRSALETAFEKKIGKVDERYLDELMGIIENEIQLYKQKLSLEQSGNTLR